MENLFKKLTSPPPEEQRVQLIRRNMLPYIQTGLSLRSVNSLSELIQLTKHIEETESRIRQFCPPPTNPRLLVEPDFAYKKPSNPAFNNVIEAINSNNRVDLAPIKEPATSVEARSQATCWNCGSTDHKFKK